MADITKLMGGSAKPAERRTDPPETQLADAMKAAGIQPPGSIVFDGKLHRFASGSKGSGKGGDKPGWYVAFPDGVPAGRFGCWRSGIEQAWRADIGRKMTAAEEMAHARRMAEAMRIRDEQAKRKQETAAVTVAAIWQEAAAASPDHPYLARKGIGAHGARVTGDGRLVVPLYDVAGQLSSIQYIDHDGGKLYHPGAKTGGAMWLIGTCDDPGPVYIAEGFATAATIFEATGRPCVAAYSASNLVPVAGAMREKLGAAADLVIVADHDQSGVGKKYADQASAKHGTRVIIPPEPGDANDYRSAGHDLAALLAPAQSDWLVPADEFSEQPAPIAWLVKRWVQQQALVMVHGPSGGGKTFVVLDWCLRIASGIDEWQDQRVKPGKVVYLAGEGHHGLRGRIAAWKTRHKAGPLSMWLSRGGVDLNAPEGYAVAAEQVRALPDRPDVIVVDTLHRFLRGDENSAQDAKTMLDACNALMDEFGCTVILVHHTGVNEEAQHRARGSSAWRGALDIEVSVVPAKGDAPMQIVQRKSKDAELAEPVYVDLESVKIPGWLDEDGEPVTSAVVVGASAPPERKESKTERHRRTFEAAWFASGAEDQDGRPFISRSAMMDYLQSHLGLSEASARTYCKPSAAGKPICELLNAETIRADSYGWLVIDDTQASAMMLRRKAAGG